MDLHGISGVIGHFRLSVEKLQNRLDVPMSFIIEGPVEAPAGLCQ